MMNMRLPILPMILKSSLAIFKYLVLFLIIYLLINWLRQPIMPVKPNLQLKDYQGTPIDIAAISQESPVLVYFWGSWCHVCTITSPKVNQLHQDGYSVVSIAVKSGDDAQLSQYLQRHQYHFTTINDTDGQIFANWQGQVTPSFVILYQGKMTQGMAGISPLWMLKLRLVLHHYLPI